MSKRTADIAGLPTAAPTAKPLPPFEHNQQQQQPMAAAAAAAAAAPTMRAVRVHAAGGPEAMKLDTVPVPTATGNQVLVRIAVSGVNFIDTYQRKGMYPVKLPHTLGREAAGVVESVGSDVKEFKAGARVVFQFEYSYADYALVPADKLVPVPDAMPLADACALLLQGMTAHALMTSTYAVKAGDNVLVQAGAGGTGQLLIQIAKLKGATVLTTVGSKEKAAIAKALGADHVINYTETPDFVEEVKKATGGKLCAAVYDGVGATTALKSLKCCALLGHLVLFGNASGKAPAIDPLDLMSQGSVSLTRPSLVHYTTTREATLARAGDVFVWAGAGKLRVSIGKTFDLTEAADAHKYLEGRASTGKILLVVDAKLAKL